MGFFEYLGFAQFAVIYIFFHILIKTIAKPTNNRCLFPQLRSTFIPNYPFILSCLYFYSREKTLETFEEELQSSCHRRKNSTHKRSKIFFLEYKRPSLTVSHSTHFPFTIDVGYPFPSPPPSRSTQTFGTL